MSELGIGRPNQEVILSKKGSHKNNVLSKIIKVKVKYKNMFFRKILVSIKNILAENKLAVILILIAAFLRFYNFYDAVTFLGDQGRDAIIIKRIVTLEHFPAIGAPTSIGAIFLGPFYYYFLSPFLLLGNFNPVGLALGVALISLAGMGVIYFFVKKYLNKNAALWMLALITFSYVQIELARFSWNPNLLPLFAFMTLYFFSRLLEKPRLITAVIFGAFFAFSLQLHYLAALLILPILTVFIFKISQEKKKSALLKAIGQAVTAFVFCSLPLVIFDLKHQFLNTNNLLKLFSSNSFIDKASYFDRFQSTLNNFFLHIFNHNFSSWCTLAVFLLSIIYYCFNFKKIRKNYLLNINYLNYFFYLIFFAFLNSPRYPHYFGAVYYSFYLVVGYQLSVVSYRFTPRSPKGKTVFKIICILFIAAYIFSNSQKYLFFQEGNSQLKRAENIAKSIIQRHPQSPYQIVALPSTETDGHIRYFLEIKNYHPMPEDTNDYVKELYVLCREEKCSPDNNPQWQIAAFKNAKIIDKWFTEDFYIYKIIHGN